MNTDGRLIARVDTPARRAIPSLMKSYMPKYVSRGGTLLRHTRRRSAHQAARFGRTHLQLFKLFAGIMALGPMMHLEPSKLPALFFPPRLDRNV